MGGRQCLGWPAYLLPSLTLTRQIFLLCFPDASFSGTPPSYAYDADRAEEQRRHHDMMPYIDDSPSSSPHLSSKSRGSRDTLSSGSLESTKSVSSFLPFLSQQSLTGLQGLECFNREQKQGLPTVGQITWHNIAVPDWYCRFKAKLRFLADAEPELQGWVLCVCFLSLSFSPFVNFSGENQWLIAVERVSKYQIFWKADSEIKHPTLWCSYICARGLSLPFTRKIRVVFRWTKGFDKTSRI